MIAKAHRYSKLKALSNFTPRFSRFVVALPEVKRNENIWNIGKELLAMTLSALLLTIVLVQGFHAHTKTEKGFAENHYHVAAEKCAICDFNSHQQPTVFAFAETILPLCYEVNFKQVQLVFEQQLTHRQLLAAADRGPPSINA